jgi:hypothetical protein
MPHVLTSVVKKETENKQLGILSSIVDSPFGGCVAELPGKRHVALATAPF